MLPAQAEATAQAGASSSTAEAVTTKAAATQAFVEMAGRSTQPAEAIILAQTVAQARRQEAADENWSRLWWVWYCLAPLAVGGVGLAVVVFVGKILLDAWMEWQDRKRRMYETRRGTVVWMDDGSGTLVPVLLGDGMQTARRVVDLNAVRSASELDFVTAGTDMGAAVAQRHVPRLRAALHHAPQGRRQLDVSRGRVPPAPDHAGGSAVSWSRYPSTMCFTPARV